MTQLITNHLPRKSSSVQGLEALTKLNSFGCGVCAVHKHDEETIINNSLDVTTVKMMLNSITQPHTTPTSNVIKLHNSFEKVESTSMPIHGIAASYKLSHVGPLRAYKGKHRAVQRLYKATLTRDPGF